MAGDLQGFALEKAELLSSRLKELMSSGQGFVRAQFGLDLGLKPELYPTWVILSSVALGLGLLLLGLFWAALCGGQLAGKKRGCPVTQSSFEPAASAAKANVAKTTKPEEPKKKNKKKPPEKKTQSNGQPVTVAQEEVKVTEVVSKRAPPVKTEKAPEVQAPAQAKKNRKKAKADVKPVQHVSTTDGKEADDGAWETKVSNREKRQQRRKDKGSEDSGSPGGVEAPKTHAEPPVVAVPSKKNKGNHEAVRSKATGKGDAASGAVSPSWREEPSVNGGGWTDMSVKIPGQSGAMEGNKWSTIPTAKHRRAQPEPQRWGQDSQAAWSGIDGRIKSDLNRASFSVPGLNTADPVSNSVEPKWVSRRNVDDEWSGFNGTAAADPSSDWNAPAEHWGNYEEPPVLVAPAPLKKEQPVTNKASEDEKDGEDPSGGAAKSKKRRKKKKKTEEEAASDAQTANTAAPIKAAPKPQELPAPPSKKQNSSISSSQKKPEQAVEPPKPSQKKKVRRET